MTITDIGVTDFVEKVGVPVAVAVIGLLATLAAAALSFAIGRWNDSTSRRRDGYAMATRQLVAYAEYPYRIRRRTSDDPEELGRLAKLGHDIQEALRYYETWIGAENRWVATVFRQVRRDLSSLLAPACNDAWNTAPVAMASGMVLAGWGPEDVDVHIERFESAVAFRFGWRRFPAFFGWHPGFAARRAQEQ